MSGKTRPIQVEFSLTINLGNFNSAKLGCILGDEVAEGESFEDKFDILYSQIRTKIRKELTRLSHKVTDVTTAGGQDGKNE